MIHDKTGKRLMPSQLVDLKLDGQHTPDGMYTASVVHVEDSSSLTKTPGFVVLQVMLRIPAAILQGKERVPCYIVREALREPDRVTEVGAGEQTDGNEPSSNVRPMTPKTN